MRLIDENQFKEQYADLYKEWSEMTKEQLLEQIVKESVDAVNMDTRVSLFMEHCTPHLSKTTYTLDVLLRLINDKKEADLKYWCEMTIEDSENEANPLGYIAEQVKEQADKEL